MSRLFTLLTLLAGVFLAGSAFAQTSCWPQISRCFYNDGNCYGVASDDWVSGPNIEMNEGETAYIAVQGYADNNDPYSDEYCAAVTYIDSDPGNGGYTNYSGYWSDSTDWEFNRYHPEGTGAYMIWNLTDLESGESLSPSPTGAPAYKFLGYERVSIWLNGIPIDLDEVTCSSTDVTLDTRTYAGSKGGHGATSQGCCGIDPPASAAEIQACNENADWTLEPWPPCYAETGFIVTVHGDADRDGVLNPDDNCIVVPNGPNDQQNQVDSNGDGYGNACDCDFNDDNVCAGPDSVIMSQKWLCEQGQECWDEAAAQADMNADGVVGSPDSVLFSLHWMDEMPDRGLDHCNAGYPSY